MAPRPGLQSHLAFFSMSYILRRGRRPEKLGHDEVVRFLTTNLNEESGQDKANTSRFERASHQGSNAA